MLVAASKKLYYSPMSKSSRQQQRFWLLIAFAIVGYAASQYNPESASQPPPVHSVQAAYAQQQSDVQLEITASIIKLLPDDDEGTRHQKFLVTVPSGLTVLVAHNIDLAPRIKQLKKGTQITLYGEYEWSQKGGILHWTHHDPQGRHPDGWIDYQGHRYQ